nr:hypothetical protein [Candidatus Freyarchaeota archaeon]
MSKIHFVLASLITVALLALVVGPIMGAGVVSSWCFMPNMSWLGCLGWFGWLFLPFPYPI